jgi:hypothetical protein
MRARYGASPAHLAGHLLAFAVIGYAVWALLVGGSVERAIDVVVWLVAGAALHDLVLLPSYSAADRGAQRVLGHRRTLLNHLRLPAAISLVLLLVFLPLILSKAEQNYVRATGERPGDYTRTWLLITAGLFAASALHYLLRSRRQDLQRPGAAGDEDAARGDGDGVRLPDGPPAA